MSHTPNFTYPPFHIRAWRCLVTHRKTWKLARSASRLACYAWRVGDDDLWGAMSKLQNHLWAEIYPQTQQPCTE